jgi:hypothetical protein
MQKSVSPEDNRLLNYKNGKHDILRPLSVIMDNSKIKER